MITCENPPKNASGELDMSLLFGIACEAKSFLIQSLFCQTQTDLGIAPDRHSCRVGIAPDKSLRHVLKS